MTFRNSCYTKDEIVGLLLIKLSPSGEEIFADIGCGTGNVSFQMAKYCRKVYAIDVKEDAIRFVKKKAEQKGIDNIETFHGSGVDFLNSIDAIDIAFFGGTRDIGKMLIVAGIKVRGKIVVNLARMGIAERVIKIMTRLGMFEEVIMVNVAKGYDLAGDIAFRSENPVFMVVGDASKVDKISLKDEWETFKSHERWEDLYTPLYSGEK